MRRLNILKQTMVTSVIISYLMHEITLTDWVTRGSPDSMQVRNGDPSHLFKSGRSQPHKSVQHKRSKTRQENRKTFHPTKRPFLTSKNI